MDTPLDCLNFLTCQLEKLEEFQAEETSLFISTVKTLNEQVEEILINEENDRIIKKTGFNIFSCLTRHHLEQLHTNFIRYLLCPKESHYCGSEFLKLFIETLLEDEVIKASDKHNILNNVTTHDYNNANVHKKDKNIRHSTNVDEYGKIDVYVEMKLLDIFIENKTARGEQPRQMERYIYSLELQKKQKGKDYLALFLTPEGWTSNTAGIYYDKYFRISYRNHISRWLEKCITRFKDYPKVDFGLNSYFQVINQHILHNISNRSVMEIADLLLQKENRAVLKQLHNISRALIDVRNKIRDDFFKKLAIQLKRNAIEFQPYILNRNEVTFSDISQIWNSKSGGLKFSNDSLIYKIDGSHSIHCGIEHGWDNIWIGCFIIKNKEILLENNLQQEIIKSVESRMGIELSNSLLENQNEGWFAWFQLKVGFGSDEFNYELLENMDNIIEQWIINIDQYLKAWKKTTEALYHQYQSSQ
jgi:hypothetical protein